MQYTFPSLAFISPQHLIPPLFLWLDGGVVLMQAHHLSSPFVAEWGSGCGWIWIGVWVWNPHCGWRLAISLPILWLDGDGDVDKGSLSLSPSCGRTGCGCGCKWGCGVDGGSPYFPLWRFFRHSLLPLEQFFIEGGPRIDKGRERGGRGGGEGGGERTRA